MNESASVMDIESVNNIKLVVAGKDPACLTMIANDITLMGGLVFALDCEKNELLSMAALEAFTSLASLPEVCTIVRDFIGVIPTLKKITSEQSTYSKEMQNSATELLHTLTMKSTECEKSRDQSYLGQMPLADVANTQHTYKHDLDKETVKAQRRRRTSTLLRNAKTIVLLIRGMVNKEDEHLVRRSFASVKGVISIIVDFNKKRCTIRAKLSLRVQLLAVALSRTMTMTADQIVKDEDGNEVCVPLTSDPTEDLSEKENSRLPEYPEDSPEKPVGKDDIVKPGYHDHKQQQGWGFFKSVGKSVGDFFSDSLYW